jgi:hypothetical protein
LQQTAVQCGKPEQEIQRKIYHPAPKQIETLARPLEVNEIALISSFHDGLAGSLNLS